MKVGPGQNHHWDQPAPSGMGSPVGEDEQDDREEGHPEQLRAEGHGRGRDDEGPDRQQRRSSVRQPSPPGDDEQANDDDAEQTCAEQRQSRPAADLEDRGQDRLGSPLLVEPGLPGHRERPRIDRRDRSGRQDPGAGPQLIGQIDRREARHERGDDRERDRQERPKSRQGHCGRC